MMVIVGSVLFGMCNMFLVGVEFNYMMFQYDNNLLYVGMLMVDLFNVDLGSFINMVGMFLKYCSQLNQYVLFVENWFEIMLCWLVIGGLCYDYVSVNCDDFVNGGVFMKVFVNMGWCIGIVYDVWFGFVVYGQYLVVVDLVSLLLLLNVLKVSFMFVIGWQIEIGVKQLFFDGKVEWMFVVYWIVKCNFLMVDLVNLNQLIQVGQQLLCGLEVMVGVEIVKDWCVDVNVLILCVKYDDFQQLFGGMIVLCVGNVLVLVLQWFVNLWISWCFVLDWIGIVGVKYVGKWFVDIVNQFVMLLYMIVDFGFVWKLCKDMMIIVCVYNVFNCCYVQFVYYNEMQYLFGNDWWFELLVNYWF